MEQHKAVFTEYLRNAPHYQELGRSQRQDWKDWLSDQGLQQCAGCRRYGIYGEEVHCIAEGEDNPGVRIDSLYCDDCIVRAWAWTNNEMMLAVECPRGEEKYWLSQQAEYYGDASGLREWGYEGQPSHAHNLSAVQKTAIGDLRVGDHVYVLGYRTPQVITKVEANRITVKAGRRSVVAWGREFDRVITRLADAIR